MLSQQKITIYRKSVMNLNVFRNYINWIRIMPNMRKQPPM